ALMGGCDSCGEQLCCTRNLKEFKPVPIRVAKDQNFSGNPDKLTGLCGRLKCCMLYEHPTYAAVKGSLPGLGKTVQLPEGRARVTKIDIFREEVVADLEDGRQVALPCGRGPQPAGPHGPADD
ncbi:MAG: regulatory iron-sulfur-containing complex subunit RicT, partial [Candidatus Tectimicrobiota bacterium]